MGLGRLQPTARLALRTAPQCVRRARPSSCQAPWGPEDGTAPDALLLTRKDGPGQAGLGQQIRQGLRMCFAIDRTDAGLAGPRGRWGLPARLGQGLGAPSRGGTAARPSMLRSAHPEGRVPGTGLAPERAVVPPATEAWRGPQDARQAVPAGQGTLAPGEVGTGPWARARCRDMEKGQVPPRRPRREGTEGGDVSTHETRLQGGEVLPEPRPHARHRPGGGEAGSRDPKGDQRHRRAAAVPRRRRAGLRLGPQHPWAPPEAGPGSGHPGLAPARPLAAHLHRPERFTVGTCHLPD